MQGLALAVHVHWLPGAAFLHVTDLFVALPQVLKGAPSWAEAADFQTFLELTLARN